MSEPSTAIQLVPESKSMRSVESESLGDRVTRVREEIARRAFEIFQNDGGLFGHERDHWLKAEAELLHSTHISIRETDGALDIQAEVPGFIASELEVSFGPRRLTISGKRESHKEEMKKGKVVYHEACSNELLRVIDLPVGVDATKGTATLKNGILELSVPKGVQKKSTRVEVRAA